MKSILLFLACAALARADFSDDQVPATPDILARIIAGAERSGAPLSSLATKNEPTVYYLRSAEYIGECVAPFGSVHIARLFYIRSGVRGQSSPPARGHKFLVFYDAKFHVRGFWSVDETRFDVRGTKLFADDKELFDYSRIPKHYEENALFQYPRAPVWK